MATFIPPVEADKRHEDEVECDLEKSPLLALHRMRVRMSKEARTSSEAKFRKNEIRRFLLASLFKETDCVDLKNGNTRETNCNCIGNLPYFCEGEVVFAVDYLYGFALLKKYEQQTLVKEWILYSMKMAVAFRRGDARNRATYLLPGTSRLICKDALCKLLGWGIDAWGTVVKMASDNAPPSQPSKIGLNVDHDMEELLEEYFEGVLKLAQPRATLVIRNLVRDMVETELREDDEDISELPSHMSKRSLFNRMLLQLGWTYAYDSKSRVISRDFVEGRDQQRAPSWSSFLRYWAKHHPKLLIAGAREDVCNQCYVFANRHRYARKLKDDAFALCPPVGDGGPPVVDEPPPEEDDVNEDDDIAAMEEGEDIVVKAAKHVEMAQQQRILYQQKRKEATATALLRPSERVLCYVADYVQNMYIPNFASEQPGATYYYSPLSCYVFGVVDASKDHLTAWIYTEDTAKKGGNNVASLLMQQLHHHGIVEQATTTGEPFKELNFIMDNCGGQNKNRHVLRILHFIVKRRIAVVANAIFLVRGHTKNACDRLFNTMKREYRKCNSFTPEDLVNSIKGNNKVDPVMVDDDTFGNWDKLEDVFMKRLPSGNTTNNHIFSVDINRNNGNSMFLQEANGAVEQEFKLVKPAYVDKDAAFWTQQQPEVIPPVGLQDIKWKELHHKWAKYVPEEKKPQWRYYTEAPPQDKIDEVAKQSKRARSQRAQRTRTVHDDKKKPKVDSNKDNKETDGASGAI
jgi:hypothetical protein